MTDVDHELGAIRFVVDAPLSSKVAMFNNVANQHKESQYLNPFSNSGSGLPPRRAFGKDEYGKPLAGSLTEMRGARANIHVCKEMLQLCQLIDSEGYPLSKKDPNLKVILFGDLFNIYTLISDKVVGLLLRARKYKLLDFEGEVLFQRRDDDVPIYMLKPLDEIKKILEEKQDEVRRSVSPSPQAHPNTLDNLRRSVSPAPRGEVVSREASPTPSQNVLRRSASPAPKENNVDQAMVPVTAQENGNRGSSPAKQENNLRRSVSPAPKEENQTNGVNSAASELQNKSDSGERITSQTDNVTVQPNINEASSLSTSLKPNDSECSQENVMPAAPKVDVPSSDVVSDNIQEQANTTSDIIPPSSADTQINLRCTIKN